MARADIEGLNADARKALLLVIEEARKKGIPFTVTSGRRSAAEQEALYARRGSNRYPVAKPGTSAHERGTAVDIDTAPMTRGALNAWIMS